MSLTRKTLFIALSAVAFALIAGLSEFTYLRWKAEHVPPQVSHWDRPLPAPAPNAPPEVTPAPEAAVPPESRTEHTIAEPVPYFPPPNNNLTGGSLGNQLVPGTDGIGDIFDVYFHQPTQALYMAVVEYDGTRSVWRVAQDGRVERVMVVDSQPGEIQINADGKGVIYVQADNPVRVFRSDDAFKTWHEVAHDMPAMFWSIADDGKGTLWGSMHGWNSAVLWRSPDDGFSWEPWVDFQTLFPEDAVQYAQDDSRFKLRHLHDVFYSAKSDALFVGTGDVSRYALRSNDGGRTWKKIWDEGFTAHTAVGGGDRYLLAPDQLHSHGLVLYDAWKGTLKEVWNPIPYGWAGYSYSVINADGIYYAAFHTEANEVDSVVPKFGIIVSPDAEHWYPFLEWGPLGHHARTNIWLAPADNRVYASVNGRLYAFKPLDKGWFADKTAFGK
ncbi:MAG: Photosynthesis system assembly factor [Candidatus Parcubacteria bacterium]|jgi:hypothetical protein